MRRRDRTWCGIALGLAVLAGCAQNPSTEPAKPEAAPVELTQCRFDKVEAALAEAKGRVVLVDCWAKWCGPCVKSFPLLVQKHQKYGPKGLVCISLSIDSGRKAFTADEVHAFLKGQKAAFPNFYLTDYRADSPGVDKVLGPLGGIPHAVLFDRTGARVWDGHPMDDDLVARIEAELEK